MLKDVYEAGKRYREGVGRELSRERVAKERREFEKALKGKRLLIYHPMSRRRWVI